MCTRGIGTDRCQRRAKFLGTAQALAHHRLAKSALLMFRVCAKRFEDCRMSRIVDPDCAKRGEFTIRSDGDDIEISIIDWNALDVLIPLPALVFFIGLIGMKNFPREPAAG